MELLWREFFENFRKFSKFPLTDGPSCDNVKYVRSGRRTKAGSETKK